MKKTKARTKSFANMIAIFYEVESIMISMKIDPDNIVDLLRGFHRLIKAMENGDSEKFDSAFDYIQSLRHFAVKKATK